MARHPHVTEVHDLHVWEIGSGFPALSAHVLVEPDADCHGAPPRARGAARGAVRDRAHDAPGRPRRSPTACSRSATGTSTRGTRLRPGTRRRRRSARPRAASNSPSGRTFQPADRNSPRRRPVRAGADHDVEERRPGTPPGRASPSTGRYTTRWSKPRAVEQVRRLVEAEHRADAGARRHEPLEALSAVAVAGSAGQARAPGPASAATAGRRRSTSGFVRSCCERQADRERRRDEVRRGDGPAAEEEGEERRGQRGRHEQEARQERVPPRVQREEQHEDRQGERERRASSAAPRRRTTATTLATTARRASVTMPSGPKAEASSFAACVSDPMRPPRPRTGKPHQRPGRRGRRRRRSRAAAPRTAAPPRRRRAGPGAGGPA